MNTSEIQALHQRHVLTPWAVQGGLTAPVITRAEGRYLYDSEGKKYFDMSSGLIAVNLGHGHPKVVKAIQDQAATLCYAAPSLFLEARAELAAELSRLSPFPEGARTFFTTGGAESNDDVVRMARTLTGRNKIMTAYRSFHGASGTSITLTGEDRRWGGEGNTGAGIVRFFAPFPYRSNFYASSPEEECERALAHIENIFTYENPKHIAALIIEPVVGSNGVIVYPDGYLAGLRKLTEKHGILLVFDEVMTGFGRCGAAFACMRWGVTPDIITFAKGVTSAYLPLGGVMVRENIAKYFDDKPIPNGHTYSGHPMTMAAGLATLRAYREEGIFERSLEVEAWLKEGLAAMQKKHSIIGDVRGVGGFFAVECVKDQKTKEPLVPWQGAGGLGPMKNFYAELRKRGIYSFGKYNIAMVAPPLTVTKAELDEALSGFSDALGAFASSL